MNKGISTLLCIMTICIVVAVKEGIPAKNIKWYSELGYFIYFIGFLFITDSFQKGEYNEKTMGKDMLFVSWA